MVGRQNSGSGSDYRTDLAVQSLYLGLVHSFVQDGALLGIGGAGIGMVVR